jgi:predicted nucleic acid-binding protein
MDAFIAATAETGGLTLVTRHTSDFEFLGLPIISPWTAA